MTLSRCIALVIWALSALMAFQLLKTGWYGRLLFLSRQPDGTHDPMALARHAKAGRQLWGVIAITVLMIETARGIIRLPYIPFFFRVHLPIFLAFLVLLLLTFFWFNGVRRPRIHRRIIAFTLFFGIATVITGDVLTYRLFWR